MKKVEILKDFRDREHPSVVYRAGEKAEFRGERADELASLGFVKVTEAPKAAPAPKPQTKAAPAPKAAVAAQGESKK